MKIFLVIFAACAFSVQGQIKNAGFENWHTVPNTGGAEDPDFWESNNKALDSTTGFAVSKSTDANSGDYALKLTPTLDPARSAQIVLGEISLDSSGYPKSSSCAGDSIAFMPLVLTGYYKYYAYHSGMIAEVSIAFTEGCTYATHVFAMGGETFSPNPDRYRAFAVAIDFDDIDPFPQLDTMRITISFVDPDTNRANSFLLIDDLSLLGEYVSREATSPMREDVRLFPNPTTGLVTVQSEEAQLSSVKVYSAHGKLVLEQKAITQEQVALTLDGPAGVYFVEVNSPKGKQVFRVLKE